MLDFPVADILWRGAVAVVPLALLTALLCGCLPTRPSTRHTLWLLTLVMLVAIPFLPRLEASVLSRTADRVAALFASSDSTDADASVDIKDAIHAAVAKPVQPERQLGDDPALLVAAGGDDAPRYGLFRPFSANTDRVRENVTDSRPVQRDRADRPDRRDRANRVAGGIDGSRPSEANTLLRRDAAGAGEAWIASPRTAPRRNQTIRARTRESARSRSRNDDPGGIAGALENDGDAARAIDANEIIESPRDAGGEADETDGSSSLTEADNADSLATPTDLDIWIMQLSIVRDALLQLPLIPIRIWGAGIALILFILIVRISRSIQVVRQGETASHVVTAQVAGAARELGLRRVPETLMIDARTSPMLWCGRRSILLLPRELWGQLDDVGRRAVLFHELAHLRRRDHVVCWLMMILGCLYWWHPVVWWIRRRIREEADLCCDAWVTTLMPTARRAYAQALLDTRKYTSDIDCAVPAVGLGASTIRAKRFARRLTMVMTHQTTPSISRRGLALVGALALTAGLVVPIWACPPSSREKMKSTEAVVTVNTPPASQPSRSFTRTDAPDGSSDTTFEQFMRRQSADRQDMPIEDRIEELEERLDHLYEQLEKMFNRVGEAAGPNAAVYTMPQMTESLAAYATAVGQVRYWNAPAAQWAQPRTIYTSSYSLPSGKLQELTTLMSRSDVPIMITAGDDSIIVEGNTEQHRIIDAFCKMIDGETQVQTYKLSDGKLEAFTDLMIRGDVPILIERSSNGIKVRGSDLEQAVVADFIQLIEPDVSVSAPRLAWHDAAEAYTISIGAYLDEYDTEVTSLCEQKLNRLRQVAASMENQIEQFQVRQESLYDEASVFEDRADDLESEAYQLQDDADDLDRRGRLAAVSQVNTLFSEARQCENQARSCRAQAEALESVMDRSRYQIRAMEERSYDLEELQSELEAARDSDDCWDD